MKIMIDRGLRVCVRLCFFFFFQAEDGIRDYKVTGVQTCALPISPLCPLGLAAGRLGNFINGELWGRPASVPWAMVFPQVDAVPRHPSQLYEFGLEGIVLFVLLWFYARRRRPVGAVSGLFLIGYGSLRFLVEYAREPDNFLGVLALGLSMGQWLSLPMIVIGVCLMLWAYWRGGGGRAPPVRARKPAVPPPPVP